jgi:hypothetical protein
VAREKITCKITVSTTTPTPQDRRKGNRWMARAEWVKMGRMRWEPRHVRNLVVTGAVIWTLLGANVLTPLVLD